LYFVLSIFLMWALQRWLPLRRIIPPSWRPLALVPLAISLVVAVVGRVQFARAGTTVRPFAEPTYLMTTGVFRVSRNPLYLSLAFALVGFAIVAGTLGAFLIVPLFMWAITIRVIIPEERILLDAFGDEYVGYRSRVRRWL